MVGAGLARLGRYTRFVSLSVMTGFLTGVAANILFGQVADLCGTKRQGSIALTRAVDVIFHPSKIDPSRSPQGSERSRSSRCSPTPGRARSGRHRPCHPEVRSGRKQRRAGEDAGEIPRGLPHPALPHLSALSPNLLPGRWPSLPSCSSRAPA